MTDVEWIGAADAMCKWALDGADDGDGSDSEVDLPVGSQIGVSGRSTIPGIRTVSARPVFHGLPGQAQQPREFNRSGTAQGMPQPQTFGARGPMFGSQSVVTASRSS